MGEPLVIVGKGMAATRFVEELTKTSLGRYDVIVLGDEPHYAYNRVLLSSLLADEIAPEALELRPPHWWQARGVSVMTGKKVVSIDRKTRQIVLNTGIRLPYGKLILATGSAAIRLPIPGASRPGVITFRDRADVAALELAKRNQSKAVVIGGGLLGLEAAYGLAKAGVKVTLLHLMDRLMERQLDASAAEYLKKSLEAKGIKVLLKAETAEICGDTSSEFTPVTGLRLKDGRMLDADLVVMAIGIKPNAGIGQAAGLEVARGIKVNDQMQTSDANIFALGECAEHRGMVYGLIQPAYEQAMELAKYLAEKPASYQGSVLSTNLKVSGVHVFSAGQIEAVEGQEAIIFRDATTQNYKKFIIENNILIGCILFGETGDALWYHQLIKSGSDIALLRARLPFGRAYCESILQNQAA